MTEVARKTASDSAYGIILGIAVLIFGCLPLETQRRAVFQVFRYPSLPTGSFSEIRVLSSTLEEHWFPADRYVLTIERSANSGAADSQDDAGLPSIGVLYTVECTPHFWNLCRDLVPGQVYYGRWTSSNHDQIAITEVVKKDGEKAVLLRSKSRFFTVRGWRNKSTQ